MMVLAYEYRIWQAVRWRALVFWISTLVDHVLSSDFVKLDTELERASLEEPVFGHGLV